MKVRDWPVIRVRLHPDAMTWIRKDAEENKRTLNAEVCFCVERYIEAATKKASGADQSNPDASNN